MALLGASCGGKSLDRGGSDGADSDGDEPRGGGGGASASPGTGGSGGGTSAGGGAGKSAGGAGGTAGVGVGAGPSGGSAGVSQGGAGGTPIAGTGGGTSSNRITWDTTGWIGAGSNAFGIQGPWYPFNDCNDAGPAGLPCTLPDPTLFGPAPDHLPGWSTSESQVCMKGTAAQVIVDSTGMPAYALQWGAGIGFDLNSTGGTPAVLSPFDAVAHGITGFTFDITGVAPPTVRIQVVMPETFSTAHFVEVAVPSLGAQVTFQDCPNVLTCNLAQGSWVTTFTRFDATQIISVQFLVFTNETAPKPYDFCVSNFNVIRAAR